ncbi:head GIN domain-containing protein [Flavobacterium sp.]|uniref:head GIN domain-containing protein n=1 Tax=Flavobacterium sp. TaxID=239 RepID=UPI002489FF79|nr:head GIN domain-containing protein [Flavobacterium sp.]MDI1317827.1 DUF2807 domain-containing protein [Flavobacterium sp.]
MVKFVVFCTKVITVAIVAVLFSSCNVRDLHIGNGIDGNGTVIKQTRNVATNFTKVDVSRGLAVVLEQSNNYFVEVEADENLQEHISTRVENGTLFVTSDEDIDEATAKTIYVKLPALTTIETSSGASVNSKNVFTGTDLTIRSSSGSETDVTIEFDNIKTKATSGSSIILKGKALMLNTDTSSGSSIEAKKLLVNEVVAEASSGSSIEVHPILKLTGKASSGSSINYNSTPKTVTKEESSGGSVSKD